MDKAGHRGGLAELTRGRLTECLWQLGARDDARARALLLSCDGDGGLLAARVREVAAGRPFRQRPRSQPLATYSEREWTRLRDVCRGVVDEAYAAHRQALTAAARGRDATILLDYMKGRTAGESVTLPRPAVRLLERWLEHSALMRRFAPPDPREDLWLRFTPAASGCWHTGHVATTTLRNWVRHHELLG